MDTKKIFKSQDEEKLSYPSTISQILSFVIPIGMTALILAFMHLWYGHTKVIELLSLAVVTFIALGKFVVFAPLIPLPDVNFTITFSIFQLAAMVAYMDTITGIVMRYNLFLFEKIPSVGPKLKAIRNDCFYLLKATPWMRKIASIGIIAFVAFPVAGTGAVAGSCLCYILGLKRIYSVMLICVGGLAGSYGMALGALYFQKNLKDFLENPLFSIAGLLCVITVLVWASWKMKRMIAEQKKMGGNTALEAEQV